MWESRRDFQGVWEGWEAGFMAFHAFHTLSFPWPAFVFRENHGRPLTGPKRSSGTLSSPSSMSRK
jgi:hypothetical protein